ncbi:LOW QUALITY PROTEIN: hypothetical protein MSG28_009026 [Choristoneura fumiferana]|uniref:Uncharacterized protein n=1 Tax=Choristoneura fumiferana TaxID=7141 RepID=A0ACC0J906_CHOFU|nr:LOW QUALITY PROTEIN: hypothetical protein MSG28_009026 [Choristoneura fumiferana]
MARYSAGARGRRGGAAGGGALGRAPHAWPTRAAECARWVYCGAPYYLPALGFIPRGHWAPAAGPPATRLRAALTRSGAALQVAGGAGGGGGAPQEAARWGERRTYFFTLHDAKQPQPLFGPDKEAPALREALGALPPHAAPAATGWGVDLHLHRGALGGARGACRRTPRPPPRRGSTCICTRQGGAGGRGARCRRTPRPPPPAGGSTCICTASRGGAGGGAGALPPHAAPAATGWGVDLHLHRGGGWGGGALPPHARPPPPAGASTCICTASRGGAGGRGARCRRTPRPPPPAGASTCICTASRGGAGGRGARCRRTPRPPPPAGASTCTCTASRGALGGAGRAAAAPPAATGWASTCICTASRGGAGGARARCRRTPRPPPPAGRRPASAPRLGGRWGARGALPPHAAPAATGWGVDLHLHRV